MGARCLRPGATGRWRGARGRQRRAGCHDGPRPDLRACLACGDLLLALGHPALDALDARLCPDCRSSSR